jgi:hypothetical protein
MTLPINIELGISSGEIFDQLLALGVTDDLVASVIHEHYKIFYPLCSDLFPRKVALRAIYVYQEKYHKAPGFSYFNEEYWNQYAIALSKGYVKDDAQTLMDVYYQKIGVRNSPYREMINKEYILDQFGPHLEKERLLRVMEQSITKLDGSSEVSKHLPEVKEEIKKILLSDVGYNRIEVMSDPNSLLAYADNKILYKSGVEVLDQLGVRPEAGTLYLLAAVPNTGKSWWLTNVVGDNLKDTVRAPKVAFLTLEMTAAKTFERLAMSLVNRPWDVKDTSYYDFSNLFKMNVSGAGLPIYRVYKEHSLDIVTPLELDDLVPRRNFVEEDGSNRRPLRMGDVTNIETFWAEMESMGLSQETFMERFALFSSGPDTITIRDFEETLDRYCVKTGFSPDIIVVDYADLLKSHSDTKEFRHKLTKIYEGLRAMALTRKVAVVTVTQIRREGMQRATQGKDVTAAELAEDFIGKFAIPDVVLTLYGSSMQNALGQATISIEKTRETDHKGEKIYMQKGFQIGRFALSSWMIRNHAAYHEVIQKLYHVKQATSFSGFDQNHSDDNDDIDF